MSSIEDSSSCGKVKGMPRRQSYSRRAGKNIRRELGSDTVEVDKVKCLREGRAEKSSFN